MICRPLPSKVTDWIAPREKPKRSGGWHVSTVLVAMLKEAAERQYKQWGKVRAEPRLPTDEIGYIWEDVLAGPLAARMLVPEGFILLPSLEIERDEIFGTPDRPMLDTVRGRLVVEEAKATWMSGKTVLAALEQVEGQPIVYLPTPAFEHERKFAYWRMQTKTYAAMLDRCTWPWPINLDYYSGAPPIGRVRALFINGVYKGELALPGGWELEWTRDELEAWWANVVRFAHRHPELKSTEEEPTTHDAGSTTPIDGREPDGGASGADREVAVQADRGPHGDSHPDPGTGDGLG